MSQQPTIKSPSASGQTVRSTFSKAFNDNKGTKDGSIVQMGGTPSQSAAFIFNSVGSPINKVPIKVASSPGASRSTSTSARRAQPISQANPQPSGQVSTQQSEQAGPEASVQPSSPPSSPREVPQAKTRLPAYSETNLLWMARIEFGLGVMAFFIFLGLWVFLMIARCYTDLDMIFWVKCFALAGIVTGLYISIYSCFERRLAPRKGLSGCLFYTVLILVGSMNLIGAYLAMGCICECSRNPLRQAGGDTVIFLMEIIGSACILGALLVASAS